MGGRRERGGGGRRTVGFENNGTTEQMMARTEEMVKQIIKQTGSWKIWQAIDLGERSANGTENREGRWTNVETEWARRTAEGEHRGRRTERPVEQTIETTEKTVEQIIRRTNDRGLLVGWLLNVPATCECISGTDLLRQWHVLPHWNRSCRSNFPSHPVTVYWHRADQSHRWPYNARRLAG